MREKREYLHIMPYRHAQAIPSTWVPLNGHPQRIIGCFVKLFENTGSQSHFHLPPDVSQFGQWEDGQANPKTDWSGYSASNALKAGCMQGGPTESH